MVKETLTAKVSPKTLNRLEKHADDEGISKSEAADRLLKQGLDVEESDMRLVPVKADGGTVIEDRLDRIEQSQQKEFNRIEDTIDNLEDEPSFYNELMNKTVWFFWGLVIVGSLISIYSYYGILQSINPDVAAGFTIVVTFLFFTLNKIYKVKYE